MKLSRDELSIIMVGKLSRTSLNKLEYYKSISHCVISCWDTDDIKILNDYNMQGVKLVINKNSDVTGIGPGTLHFQTTTAYEAIKKVRTKFVIKTRLDESFSNLEPLIDMLADNKDKIIFGSPHFARNPSYHGGDHFYACKTKTMRLAFHILKKNIVKGIPENSLFNCPNFIKIDRIEQFLTRALFFCNGERNFSKEIEKEVMIRNCEICRVGLLGDLHYTQGGRTVFFRNETIPDNFEQVADLKNIRDL